MRYYLGVDWADQTHAVWVVDEGGTKIAARTVPHTAAGVSEWGRESDECRAHRATRGASDLIPECTGSGRNEQREGAAAAVSLHDTGGVGLRSCIAMEGKS